MSVLNTRSFVLAALLSAPFLSQPASAVRCADCNVDGPSAPPQQAPGCLAAGTLVTTDTGGQLAVEQVLRGQRLTALEKLGTPSASGGSNTPTFESNLVTTVYSAPNTHQMYRLTDSLGHVLTATDHHPIFTVNRGAVQLAKLNAADILLTTQGRASVARLERVNDSGQVYNFVVELGNNRGNQGRRASHTFFAGGILVGDMDVQQALEGVK
ncbi:Hint domain-containing protein [Deinococcus sp.]|uniref:Hint domain-containing protein n=1 Tax=Deinococcus sp. TaxID=47478 RepID=UPI003B5A8B52